MFRRCESVSKHLGLGLVRASWFYCVWVMQGFSVVDVCLLSVLVL